MTGAPILTGGCQCGAIRFALSAPPTRVSICHCRMCQKAVGGPFASFADIPLGAFSWTKGQPASFRSSSIAERDFCRDCGTPLSYRKLGGASIEITTGSFDQPDRLVPTRQYGTEAHQRWTGMIASLPGKTTAENYGGDKMRSIANHQHPDHD